MGEEGAGKDKVPKTGCNFVTVFYLIQHLCLFCVLIAIPSLVHTHCVVLVCYQMICFSPLEWKLLGYFILIFRLLGIHQSNVMQDSRMHIKQLDEK